MQTLAEKKLFVHELVDSVKADLLKQVMQVPEEWDGIEIRHLIALRFQSVIMGSWSRRQAREFNNEVRVRNLG